MGFDFTYSEDQLALQRTLRKFVENEMVPVEDTMTKRKSFLGYSPQDAGPGT